MSGKSTSDKSDNPVNYELIVGQEKRVDNCNAILFEANYKRTSNPQRVQGNLGYLDWYLISTTAVELVLPYIAICTGVEMATDTILTLFVCLCSSLDL